MGQLIQTLLDNLYKLWPVRIVDIDQYGIRLEPNGTAKTLSPGLHWFFPGFQEIVRLQRTIQALDCGIQTVETSDGVPVTFSINLEVKITDPVDLYRQYANWTATVVNITRSVAGAYVGRSSYATLQGDREAMAEALLKELKKSTRGSGLLMKRVLADEFTQGVPIRLLGGNFQSA